MSPEDAATGSSVFFFLRWHPLPSRITSWALPSSVVTFPFVRAVVPHSLGSVQRHAIALIVEPTSSSEGRLVQRHSPARSGPKRSSLSVFLLSLPVYLPGFCVLVRIDCLVFIGGLEAIIKSPHPIIVSFATSLCSPAVSSGL